MRTSMSAYKLGRNIRYSGRDAAISADNGCDVIWLILTREALTDRSIVSKGAVREFILDDHAELEAACNALVGQDRIKPYALGALESERAIIIDDKELTSIVSIQRS
jgi:hypothetical protein